MQIITHEIEGREKTCILLGDESMQPPKHMMQGEKQRGILHIDGEDRPWTWDGLCTIEGRRYVYFDHLELDTFDTIASKHRDKALSIVTTLATILAGQKEDFVSPLVGLFTTWRVFIVEGGRGLLILPPDLGDLISIYMTEDERQAGHGFYVKRGTEEGFAMIRQAAQLLYFALVGIRPYEDQMIRDAGYDEIPLDVYRSRMFPGLDDRTLGFINFILHAREREQRDIMGNRKGHENLAWFVSKASTLSWNVPAVEDGELQEEAQRIASSAEVHKLMDGIRRSASRRNFWRAKGTIIVIASIVALLVGSIAFTIISKALEPPVTRDLGQEDIIYAFYDAQNQLNVDLMQTAMKGCSAPQETEVISMYVTMQTRAAYEGIRPLVSAEDWIEAGRPAIANTSYIYGITDIAATDTGDDTWHVDATYYSPYPYEEEYEVTEIPQDKVLVYVYDMDQDFTFTWNDRGWWNITQMSPVSVELVDMLYVDAYDPAARMQENNPSVDTL